MKKNFFLLPVLLATTFFTVAATPLRHNDPSTKAAFDSQFIGAENVSWSKVENGFSKVSFTWAGHRAEAYFDAQSEFVGAIRGIFYDQLPLAVIRAVSKQFNKPVVLEVREITNAEGTSYSLLVEKKKGRYRVLLNNAGSVEQQVRIK